MLKTIKSPNKLGLRKNNSSRSASIRNNDNKLAFKRNDGNGEITGFNIGGNGVEYAKKSGKFFKSRKLKSKKNV